MFNSFYGNAEGRKMIEKKIRTIPELFPLGVGKARRREAILADSKYNIIS